MADRPWRLPGSIKMKVPARQFEGGTGEIVRIFVAGALHGHQILRERSNH